MQGDKLVSNPAPNTTAKVTGLTPARSSLDRVVQELGKTQLEFLGTHHSVAAALRSQGPV